jgi:hypothetical protein
MKASPSAPAGPYGGKCSSDRPDTPTRRAPGAGFAL